MLPLLSSEKRIEKMNEVWKDIKGYEGYYQVSDLGRVKSLKRKKQCSLFENAEDLILKPQERRHGYLSVWLYQGGKGKQISVHRLVANEFCDNPNCFEEVNHINEDKQDNRAINLEWVDHKKNMNLGTLQNRRKQTIQSGKGKSKKVGQYTLEGSLVREYVSLAEVNRTLGLHQGNICRHIKGDKGYSHVGGYLWKYI